MKICGILIKLLNHHRPEAPTNLVGVEPVYTRVTDLPNLYATLGKSIPHGEEKLKTNRMLWRS